jgi:mono/diheme cytochrome c family protein
VRTGSTVPRSLALALCLSLVACGPEEGSDGAMSEAAVVPMADDPSLFDTIAWADPGAALDRGHTVYAYSCARCHGPRGHGDGGYQLEGRTLRPPSFTAEDWRFADDLEGLRSFIREGTDRGMPHWGDAGLTPRDTDAVARYVQRRLWAGL